MMYPRAKKGTAQGVLKLARCRAEISGAESSFAREFFESEGIKCAEGGVKIKLVNENTRELTYIEEARRLTKEKYIILADETGITVKYACLNGLFYALNRLADEIKHGEIQLGEFTDYPLFKIRGYIEGFYGTPWQNEQRLSILHDMAKRGMNTWFYAPKDDPYHREKWREKYPEKETAELKALVEACKKDFVELNYCLAPGLSIKYTDENDFNALFEKLSSVYALGVRSFGLLLDDIPEKLYYKEDIEAFDGETVNAHIYLANKLFARLRELDKNIELTLCPMQYHGTGEEYFISKLGSSIEPEIRLFWTGHNICSQELTVREAADFIRSTRHRPLYWDNYPVNDAEMYNEMHLGYIDGRESTLFNYSEGLISNVMEYAECSRVPLYTVARYLWSPLDYNGYEAYREALYEVLGEDAESFMYFADNLLSSCLKTENSPILNAVCAESLAEFEAGSTGKAFEILSDYSKKLSNCCDTVENGGKPVYKELTRWAKKQRAACELLINALDNAQSADKSKTGQVEDELSAYLRMPETLCDFSFTELITRLINIR